jgi:hypothetical protein
VEETGLWNEIYSGHSIRNFSDGEVEALQPEGSQRCARDPLSNGAAIRIKDQKFVN